LNYSPERVSSPVPGAPATCVHGRRLMLLSSTLAFQPSGLSLSARPGHSVPRSPASSSENKKIKNDTNEPVKLLKTQEWPQFGSMLSRQVYENKLVKWLYSFNLLKTNGLCSEQGLEGQADAGRSNENKNSKMIRTNPLCY
jgi:hypothetical protein